MSEPQPTEETPEVEVEIEDGIPAAGTMFGEPRSFVLDDDWNDD